LPVLYILSFFFRKYTIILNHLKRSEILEEPDYKQ